MKKLLCILLALVLLSGCSLLRRDPAQMTGDDLVQHLLFLGIDRDYDSLSRPEQAAYVAAVLDAEIMNGGLCQFFANEPNLVPLVPEALTELGAQAHRTLYEEFLTVNGIDPKNLQEFEWTDLEDFTALYDLYPWDDFDEPYCALTPLMDLVESYIQTHAGDFQ